MLIPHRFSALVSTGNFIWIGIGIGIAGFYWVLESFVHILFFGGSRFMDELIKPDPHEIWKRLLVMILLILFGTLVQQYFNLRRRSEYALRESEHKYRTIFEQALNPIFLFDPEGRIVDTNRAALDFMDCTRSELSTKSFRDIIAADRSCNGEGETLPAAENRILEVDFPVNRDTKTMLLNLAPLDRETQRFIYGIGQDISDRKRMERRLEQAYAELDQIFQTASVGMRVVDRDCNLLKCNQTFAIMSGVTEMEASHKKCFDIFSEPMCHTSNCPINRVLGGETRFETYVDKRRLDGKIIPCILTATPFTGPDGEVIGIVESFRDIAALKEANERIHFERDKLNRILSHLLEGVSIVNTDYIIEYHNNVMRKNLGDCNGKTCYSAFRGRRAPCRPCLMLEAIESGRIQHVEYETADGRFYEQAYTRLIDVDGREKVVALLKDITEKKTSLAAAMHAEHLAAIGELAAGVAHEINNPINGIINYAQIIKNRSETGCLANEISGRIVKEGNRIARIVTGLLSFSRRRRDEKTLVFVTDVLSDALTLTSAQMRKDGISLTVEPLENPPPILAQANEIEQVFINIISNARYALNQKYPEPDDDKRLEITCRRIEKKHAEYLRIVFLDRGVGIPPDILDKIRNPFFTTKTEGKRTGLGLSISHGILENHEGEMTIDSIEGRYTRISIDLPIGRAPMQTVDAA